MKQYLITYLGGEPPATPEEGKRQFAKYKEWLSSLGAAAISPMNPIKGTRLVKSGGVEFDHGETGMSGYTIIEAASMDAAIAMARACPFLETGGALEVSELVAMA